jgi:hypothetical protein
MKRVGGAVVALAGLLCTCLRGSPAQTPAAVEESSAAKAAVVIVESDVDSAHVLLDGVFVGRTPLTLDSLPAGPHRLVAQHPDLANWVTPVLAESLTVAPGDTQRVRLLFPQRFLISSTPYGAEVLARDTIYGRTPLLLTLPPGEKTSMMTLRKDGYETLTVDPGMIQRGVFSATLTPIWQREEGAGPVLTSARRRSSNTIPLYVTGTATVLSGIAAAYFKTRADGQFTEYNRTGDPALLSQTHRLDAAAGITLAATQVGLALFTYFLLSE